MLHRFIASLVLVLTFLAGCSDSGGERSDPELVEDAESRASLFEPDQLEELDQEVLALMRQAAGRYVSEYEYRFDKSVGVVPEPDSVDPDSVDEEGYGEDDPPDDGFEEFEGSFRSERVVETGELDVVVTFDEYTSSLRFQSEEYVLLLTYHGSTSSSALFSVYVVYGGWFNAHECQGALRLGGQLTLGGSQPLVLPGASRGEWFIDGWNNIYIELNESSYRIIQSDSNSRARVLEDFYNGRDHRWREAGQKQ